MLLLTAVADLLINDSALLLYFSTSGTRNRNLTVVPIYQNLSLFMLQLLEIHGLEVQHILLWHVIVKFNLSFSAANQLKSFYTDRSSHWMCCFVKKNVLKNFASFTGKHLCCSLVLIKLQALKPASLLIRYSNAYFFWEPEKFLRTPFLKNIYEWLLLTKYRVST